MVVNFKEKQKTAHWWDAIMSNVRTSSLLFVENMTTLPAHIPREPHIGFQSKFDQNARA